MEKKIEAFEISAKTYEQWYLTPMGAYALNAELKALRKLLPKKGLGAEIGSGTGIFAANLVSETRGIVCIEPSAEMIKQSKTRNLPTVLGIAEEPPARTHCLDFAYLVTVLEFLANPVAALLSVKSLLKPEAPIIVLGINRESQWGEAYLEASRRKDSVFIYSKIYTVDEGRATLESAGYRITGLLMALDMDQTKRREESQRSIFLSTWRRGAYSFLGGNLRGIKRRVVFSCLGEEASEHMLAIRKDLLKCTSVGDSSTGSKTSF